MKRVDSSWYHLAAQGSVAVALAFPLIGVPLFAGSVLLYKVTRKKELEEGKIASKLKRERFVRNFHARQNYASYEAYLSSEVWSSKRGAVLHRSGQLCEADGCRAAATEVHHKWYPRIWGSETTDSLVALCRKHHEAEHCRKK